jgi:hypothetical protein
LESLRTSIRGLVVPDGELVSEESSIHIVVHELVVEAAQAKVLKFLAAHFLHVSFVLNAINILLDAGQESAEILEVLAVVSELRVEILVEAEDATLGGLGVDLPEVVGGGSGGLSYLPQKVDYVHLSRLSFT